MNRFHAAWFALALCACTPSRDTHSNDEGVRVDRCDLVIAGGQILTQDGPGFIEPGFIAIDDRMIRTVGTLQEITHKCEARSLINAQGKIIVPGFVDAHQHLGGMAFPRKPYEPATGPRLLSRPGAVEVYAPFISQSGSLPPVTAKEVRTAVSRFLRAMLRTGYTGVVDAGGPQPAAVAAAVAEVGIRAMVGPHLADFWPDEVGGLPVVQADATKLLDDAAEFIDSADGMGNGLVRAGVSAVWSLTATDKLLAGLADLAEAKDVPVHVHTNVLAEEPEVHARWFNGRSAIERLTDTGLLNERTTLMHSGVLSDRDIELIAASGATVNYNPLGNALLGFGVANQRAPQRLLAAGVPLVLGSDTAPDNKLTSPFESMLAALAINREAAGDDFALTLEQALRVATNGGVSLGRPKELGHIAPGQLADLVIIRPDEPHLPGRPHPVPTVVLNGHPGQIDTVIVNGRVVFTDDD